MNEFRFEHLRKRTRTKLPRPVLYVGVAIVFFAFFSVKFFQRASENAPVPSEAPPPAAADGDGPGKWVQDSWGVPALDGSGRRVQPPRKLGGHLPEIPESLRRSGDLADPRVYIRIDREGLVVDLGLISSSGNGEVDRLVLEALADYTFHPAMSEGRPVPFTMAVPVALEAGEPPPPPA
jgi:TonB family protein